jgi:TonB-linked SusC/RagA family outer membrane protein
MLLFVLPVWAAAQQKTIKGRVLDAKDNNPLVGVTVSSGTGTGKVVTTTNDKGEFSISVGSAVKELTFSYVGYADVVEKINAKSMVNVVMNVGGKDMGEVVVVGYGTQKKVTLTGSVVQLKSSEIVVTKNENVMNMLTGKVPGLRMVQRTAEPGAYENSFDLRSYGSAPLIVIDGVPRGGIERIDPNEIESISVLKDGSAAVYGVRGSNGVILVTTKKGANRNGKFDFNYSVNQGFQQFLGMPEGVGPVDYMMLTNEKVKRDFGSNFFGNAKPAYTYENIKPWIDGTFTGADWIGTSFNKFAPQTQHNLNISGGSDRVSMFFSVGYLKQGGVLKSNDLDYDRWNIRSNVNVKITDRLRAQVLVGGYLDKKNQPFQDLWTIFKYAWNAVPINQIYANNNHDYLNVMPDNANPLGITDASKVGYKTNTGKNLQSQLNLEYDIPGIKGLKARGMFNYGYNVGDNTAYSKIYNLYSYNPVDSTYTPSPVNATNGKGTLNRTYTTNTSTLSQLSLNYANTFFHDHNVSALILYEQSHSKDDNIYAQRYILLPVDYLFGGENTEQSGGTNSNGVNEIATRAIVGRVNYDYKGKYLAEFSFRRDGSNKFKPGPSQWGFFPAYSAGWRISEEPFFNHLVSPNLVSNLKLRASYGVLGNDGDVAFQYISGYTYPSVDPADNKPLGYMFNGQFVNGSISRGLVNDNLTWYTSYLTNIGLDFTVLKGRIDGSFEVFRRDQKGLKAKRSGDLPGTAGISLPFENLNEDRSQGWELALNYKNKIGDLGINVGGNLTYSRRSNRRVQEDPRGNAYDQWKNGQSNRYNNIWWGVDYGGQFTSYDQIYNYGVNTGGGNNTVLPGDYYMQDWNHDGVINDDDKHPIATYDLPLMNFGFNIGLTYKGFDLSALFAGGTGFWTQYGEQLGRPLMYGHSALAKFLDSWHTVNPDDNVYDPNTKWVAGKYPSMGYNYDLPNNSTKGVHDATYVRLKTLELGYSLPRTLLNRVGVKNCRVYVNSYNLFTISSLDDGVDPEHPGEIPTPDNFNFGLGGYKYPLNRTFNVGANISF